MDIQDYLTQVAVNVAYADGSITKEEALLYVTDVAARVALSDSDDSDDEVEGGDDDEEDGLELAE